MTENNGLSPGWALSTIGKICDTTSGGTPSRKVPSFYGGDIPWLKSGELNDSLIYEIEEFITEDGLQNSSAKIFPQGTLVIALYGATVGRLGILGIDAATNQAICALFPPEELDKKFLFWFLRKQRDELLKARIGGAQPNISQTILRAVEIPIPPRPEQERIVAKIEELFTQLEAGVTELQQAKAQLQRYRQAVLKSAVEGELTREWRKARGKGGSEIRPDESAEKLLARILSERRAKWEEGQETGDGRRKKKYKEPAPPDTDGLPELPEGWVWATMPQIGELNRGKSKHRPRNAPHLYGGPYPFVQTGDVRHANGILREYSQTYSEDGLAQSRLWPEGTLCITIAANIADTAILGFDACFPDSVVGFLADPKHCNIRYLEYFLRTAKTDLERYAPATAQKNINLKILSEVAIPLPSLEEQNVFFAKVERRLSVADEIEKELDQALARAERLRQSILKRAFEGRLV
ncbi:MAG: restriction endonuclease subunit S [Anaerolineae bacterium]|nr:restriction endonuclease subunit S [Anaerolineae bacterium]